MQNFSGAILITDLDDFIRPSQECIKPVVVEKKPTRGRVSRRIEIDQDSGTVNQIERSLDVPSAVDNKIKLNKVQINLSDCLACSGCVTSAESFLVNQQSVDEVVNKFQLRGSQCRKQLFVASLSTQTYVSFAARLNTSVDVAARRLSSALRKAGFDIVLDVGVSRSVSLIASCQEFKEKYRNSASEKLPIFASSCPGWICYAEKTAGDFVLPYISRVKSPQQIMGILVKNFLAKHHKYAPEDVYHLAIMPCYDKKLEASRLEFTVEGSETRHVDSVLTSGEVGQLFEKLGIHFDENFSDESDFDLPVVEAKQRTPLLHFGSGSGGFAEHILRYVAKEVGGIGEENLTVTRKVMRNEDMIELSIENFPLKFAIANGFRNIQNVVHRLKTNPKAFSWSYVEIMACPTGCVGGGGQLPMTQVGQPSDGSLFRANREMVVKMKKVFYEDGCDVEKYWAWNEPLGSAIYEMLERDSLLELLFTNYKAVEKTVTTALKW